MSQLEVHNLTKRFAGVTAVTGVTFTLADGELLTLLGPSGCGKTTTLRLIAGFIHPDVGEIIIDGESMLRLPPERRRIGFVFQNYALFPHMTVAANIGYGLRFHRGIDRKQRIAELLRLVRLDHLAARRPGDLSGGEKQRVALARALAPYPRVLLLDEPLSALDAKLREELRGELRRIQRALKLTTLYVTHDQDEGLAVSDRIGVMHTGRIEQLDTPMQVYEQPRTPFVAAFIGRVNRLSGTVASVTASVVTVRVGGVVIHAHVPEPPVVTGEPVTVFVREEDVHADTDTENCFAGRVIDTEYHGGTAVATVVTPIGTLRGRTTQSVNRGNSLTLCFPADRVFVFPRE